jgi:aminomethyltransferase
LGFEVWCHPDNGPALWDAIWDAGKSYGLAPLGFDALDMLRIEAGLIFAEHEFCNQTNPYEAGIGFTVPMKTKEEDFSGRAALQRQSPESRQKLVGLVLDGNEPVHHGDLVYDGRMPVGQITSATASPLLGKMIALCRVQPAWAEPGTRLEVGQLDGLQKRLPAQVQALPFHDPERIRVRS